MLNSLNSNNKSFSGSFTNLNLASLSQSVKASYSNKAIEEKSISKSQSISTTASLSASESLSASLSQSTYASIYSSIANSVASSTNHSKSSNPVPISKNIDYLGNSDDQIQSHRSQQPSISAEAADQQIVQKRNTLQDLLHRTRHYHHMNKQLEERIDQSKLIYNFKSTVKQFAFCALESLPTHYITQRVAIDKIKRAKIFMGTNWDTGIDGHSYPFGKQSGNIHSSISIDYQSASFTQHLVFIYYSPTIMNIFYTKAYPYQNYSKNFISNDANINTIISNFKFHNNLNFKYNYFNDPSGFYRAFNYSNGNKHNILTVKDINSLI